MEDMAYCLQPQNLDRGPLSLLLGALKDLVLDLRSQIKASYTLNPPTVAQLLPAICSSPARQQATAHAPSPHTP